MTKKERAEMERETAVYKARCAFLIEYPERLEAAYQAVLSDRSFTWGWHRLTKPPTTYQKAWLVNFYERSTGIRLDEWEPAASEAAAAMRKIKANPESREQRRQRLIDSMMEDALSSPPYPTPADTDSSISRSLGNDQCDPSGAVPATQQESRPAVTFEEAGSSTAI